MPVICHNDTYEPNYLATEDGDLYLIDWEYAGMNDPANDLACFFCRYDYTDEQIEQFMREYFQRELTPDEHRHWWAYIALCAFYWFGWGFYKGRVSGRRWRIFLPSCLPHFERFIDDALDVFESDMEFMDIIKSCKMRGGIVACSPLP